MSAAKLANRNDQPAADSILEAKVANPDADTGEQEAEVDRLVYEMYGLTAGEIAVVEGR